VVLICIGCGAEPSPKLAPNGERDSPSPKAAPSWDTDFQAYLELIQETLEGHDESTRKADKVALNKIFTDKTVTWVGTLMYVKKGRPYIDESFVLADGTMMLARVRYYPDPDQVSEWEKIDSRSKVQYTGTITDVGIVGVGDDSRPFPYVVLKHVKPIKVVE